MSKVKKLFTAGQFAKMHNINKRTLHYYDEINLFSPAHKGENGYRYYTYQQSATLEMLLTLRELHMSIEEISSYMENRSVSTFREIIAGKTAEIEKSIKRLKEIQRLLAHKEKQLEFCQRADMELIEIVECDAEYLLLSRSITGGSDEDYYAALVEHTQALRDHRLYNKSYGSMISAKKIMEGDFDIDDFYFTKVEKPRQKSDLFERPAGNYIRAFCKGNWDKLPDTYRRITAFAKKNGLTLKGYAFEVGINEMAIESLDEYVTLIMIRCE